MLSVLLILMLSVVCSCKDNDETSYYLKLETASSNKVVDTLFVESDGVSLTFSVKSNGAWKIVSNNGEVDWLNIQPTSGSNNGSFKLSVGINESLNSRE